MDRIIHSASVSDNSNKTPEEIEAEEEARRNGETAGAIIGGTIAVKEYFDAKKEAAKANEEPKTDNASDDDEDEGHGFNMHM